jgi:hypothetical protein
MSFGMGVGMVDGEGRIGIEMGIDDGGDSC